VRFCWCWLVSDVCYRKLLEELVGVKPPSDNSEDNNGSKFNSLDVFLARMLEGWLARVGLV
jgi:hypothetical protein